LTNIKSLINDVFIYGIANAFSKMISLILLPIMVHFLNQTEYGLSDGINVFISLLLPLIIFGQDSSVARYSIEVKNEEEKKQMISQSFFFQLLLGLLLIVFLFLFADEIGNFFLNSIEAPRFIKLSAWIILFQFINQFACNLLKWHFQRIRFLILSVCMPISITIVTIILLKFSDLGLISIFYSQIIVGAFFSIVGLYFVKPFLTIPDNFKWLPNLIKFGWPYFVIMFLPMVLPSIDRFLITHLMSLKYLAVYALAFRLASIIYFPIYGFQTAWGPFALRVYKEGNHKILYNLVLKSYILVLLIVIILIAIFIKPLVSLLSNSDYSGAKYLVVPIMLAVFFESISLVTGMGIDISKKSYLSAIAYLAGIIIGGLFTWILTLKFQLVGLVYGGMFGKLLFTIIKSYLSDVVTPLPFEYKKIVPFVFLGILFCLFLNYTLTEMIYLKILLGLLMIGSLILTFWFWLLNQENKEAVLVFTKRYVK
jgi:O-antigen/teichoic acid export membrane protein